MVLNVSNIVIRIPFFTFFFFFLISSERIIIAVLHMHNIQLWIVLLVSIALGVLSAIVVHFFFAPYLKKKILEDADPIKLQPGSKINFTCGDTGKLKILMNPCS